MAAENTDHLTGWTVQSDRPLVKPEDVPGNVVTYDELPFRKSVQKAGIDEDQYLAGLVIAVDEEEKRAIRGEDERAVGAEDKDEKVADVDKPKRSRDEKKDADEVADKGVVADNSEDTKSEAVKDDSKAKAAAKK